MRVPRSGIVAAAVLLSLGLGACGKSSTKTAATTTTVAGSGPGTTAAGSPTTAAAGAPDTITIKNFAFSPNPGTFKVGDKITVTNSHDGTNHTLTAVGADGFTPVPASAGGFDTPGGKNGFQGTTTITLTKAGTFSYECKIHTYMKGKLTVTP